MKKYGVILLSPFLISLWLSIYYLPQDKITRYHGSSSLTEIPLESKSNPYGFSLNYIDIYTGRSKTSQYPPFLFIHGHKGNATQAIEMAQYFGFHDLDLDFYSIDFKGGAVAFSHNLMNAEAQFVVDCLNELSIMYEKKITIIAHSMGGIVTSLALSLPNAPVGRISTIIALSTPFEAHPTNFYLAFPAAYAKVHNFWLDPKHEEIFILSATGGVKDWMIPSRLTNIEELNDKNSLHAYTTQIEDLHLQMNHNELVYGSKFLGKLNQAIKAILDSEPSEIKENVNKIWQNKVNKLLNYIGPKTKIEKVIEIIKVPDLKEKVTRVISGKIYSLIDDNTEGIFLIRSSEEVDLFIDFDGIYQLEAEAFKLNNQYYYKINSPPDSTSMIQSRENAWISYEFYSKNPEELSFSEAFLFGIDYKIKGSDSVATHITPGLDFSQGRYPIRIKSKNDEKFSVIYGKCGIEEIVKYNENDFTFYFNEYCADGPDIWILGYDPEKVYEFEISIDFIGMFIMLSKEFRLTVVSMAASIGIILTFPSKLRWILLASIAGLLYLASCTLRVYGFLGWDHVHNPHQHLGIIDVAFIMATGYGIAIIMAFNYVTLIDFSYFVCKKVPQKHLLKSYYLAVLILIFPWITVLILTVICFALNKSKSVTKGILFPSFLLLFLTISQQISWYLNLVTFSYVEILNLYDGFNILCYLSLLFAITYTNKTIKPHKADVLIAFYMACCGQDLLYRTNFSLSLHCLGLGLRIYLSKTKEREED
ncbi:unnamed protein product [Blepharisma stoltei]|uniref:GPI inositol-deacylase n=1 Tax=Blepharisma stoltei TaxID=1481888 RepID=A0AAU9J0U5_9CILI|nr:unnamed protein product [Blepharisma stoltei]